MVLCILVLIRFTFIKAQLTKIRLSKFNEVKSAYSNDWLKNTFVVLFFIKIKLSALF